MQFLTASTTLLLAALASAQTYTSCNPLHQTCPANKALGKSFDANFVNGASSDFTTTSQTVSYGSDGASFIIKKSGDAPTIASNWYIMFGKVEVTMKASPGTGIVSTIVMQSDDLDEIDLEFVGGDSGHVQSNYFGKGITGGYDRAQTHAVATSQSAFNIYSVDWSSEQIVWMINGQTVRVLTAAQAGNQYPQTPMQIKIGSWAGGDSSNNAGTISWAGGATNYAAGPFTMGVKDVKVTDYSTGTEYKYGDNSGSWQSIQAVGGSVHSGGSSSGTDVSAPATTQVTTGQPSPFSGTHADGSSGYVTPTGYPWVGSSTLTTSAAAASCFTGRPSGWTCSDTGKLLPPSSAASTQAPSSPSSALQSASPSSGAEGAPVITAAPSQPAAPAVTQPGQSTLTSAVRSNGTQGTGAISAPRPSFTGAASNVRAGGAAAVLGGVAGLIALF